MFGLDALLPACCQDWKTCNYLTWKHLLPCVKPMKYSIAAT